MFKTASSTESGWLAQIDRARRSKQKKDTLRQFANGSKKPLPKWAEAQFK